MIELLVPTVTSVAVAVLAWWLTERSRDRADAKGERAALEVQADAMLVAVTELLAATKANGILWEGLAERGRSFLLASIAAGGGYSRARLSGRGPEWLWHAVGLAAAGRSLGEDRRATKRAIAAITTPLGRLAAAAAPLLRHPDRTLAEATQQLLDAAYDTRRPGRLEPAAETFKQAVRAALLPPPSRWARLRAPRRIE